LTDKKPQQIISLENNQHSKARLHTRNRNQEQYDLSALTSTNPELKHYIKPNKLGFDSGQTHLKI
jgi:hypothetical protein